jgi:hypothetical protein
VWTGRYGVRENQKKSSAGDYSVELRGQLHRVEGGNKKATEMVGGERATRELLDQGVGEICRMVITGVVPWAVYSKLHRSFSTFSPME